MEVEVTRYHHEMYKYHAIDAYHTHTHTIFGRINMIIRTQQEQFILENYLTHIIVPFDHI